MTSHRESRRLAAAETTLTAPRDMWGLVDDQEQDDNDDHGAERLLVATVEDSGTDGDGDYSIDSDEITGSRRHFCCRDVSRGDDDASSSSSQTRRSCGEIARREARILLLDLALPTVLIQLATAFPTFWASSFVGRNFGHLSLAGFTLANLTTNLFSMSLLQGLYTASDTLGPAYYAVRSTRSLLGILAVRGFVLSLAVALPVAAVLSAALPQLLASWGEDPAISGPAVLWYRITALSLPFYAAVMVSYKFLAAQRRLTTVVLVLGLSAVVVLPLCVRAASALGWGYAGTAWAVSAFQTTEAALLLLCLWIRQPHDPESWVSWRHSWTRALSDTGGIRTYLRLGLGGILASTSWVYWETVCLLVGSRIGPLALSAHCVACQVLCLLYMLPQGVGVAIALRVGSVAAAPTRAFAPKPKVLVWACLAASTLVFAVLSVSLYAARDAVLGWFTTEDVLVQEARRIWARVCWYNFNTSLFGIHFGIATALGMQRLMGLVTVIVLWTMAFPVMYWLAFASQGNLGTVWSCLWPPYLAINLTMFWVLLTRDWENAGRQVDPLPSPSLDALQASLLGEYGLGSSDEGEAADT